MQESAEPWSDSVQPEDGVSPTICKAHDVDPTLLRLSYPREARHSLNRCNLTAEALASLAYQLAPVPLELDGVAELHRRLVDALARSDDDAERRTLFLAHMRAHFLLDDPASQGLSEHARLDRSRADYLKLLRGWHFDPDGREAAVLKGWVESRFGLRPSYHGGPLAGDPAAQLRFERARAAGLYGTGALEAQVDLLYAYCQHALQRQHAGQRHLRLYRGYGRRDALDVLARLADGVAVVRFNSLSSFSHDRERADEFGDHVLACDVPLPKILAFSGLLPRLLEGEGEYLVVGGVMLAHRLC